MVDDLPLYVWLIILAVLIALSAFFAGTETALMALNRYRLRHLAKSGHRGAQFAERLLARPDRLIGMILLGNIAVHSASAAITTFLTLRMFGEVWVSAAIAVLPRATSRTIDLGEVTLRLADPPAGSADMGPRPLRDEVATFAIGCGIGFDARVMATTPPHLKRRFGRSAYFAQ